MATIPQISEAMREVLGPTADRLGWQTGFNRRLTKLTGSAFTQALVFSSLEGKDITYTRLSQGALDAGVEISNQGMEQRFGRASADLCRGVLEAAVEKVISGEAGSIEILERFNGIHIRDSSVVTLPDELVDIWEGVGDCQGQTATVKLQVRLDYSSGQMAGPVLQSGRTADSQSPFQDETLPRGAIRMGDLGFFSLEQFAKDQADGVYTFSRYKIGTLLYDENGNKIDLLRWVRSETELQFERVVYLGKIVRFPCRILGERVPQAVAEKRRRKLKEYARKKQANLSQETLDLAEWTLIITDIPLLLLSVEEAMILLAVRWQIELLFKLWKSLFEIDQWRSENPWRILTELYAKLIAVVLLHWTFLVEIWHYPNRSLWKAALVVQKFASELARNLSSPASLEKSLSAIQAHFRHSCRMNSRSSKPNTYQRLLALSRSPDFPLLEAELDALFAQNQLSLSSCPI